MIGRISVLGSATLFGIIKADNGLSVRFDHSAVMAYGGSEYATWVSFGFPTDSG